MSKLASTPPSHSKDHLAAWSRRIFLAGLANHALVALAIGLFYAGCWILTQRRFLPTANGVTPWFFASLGFIAAVWAFRATRRAHPNDEELRAFADDRMKTGGLALSLAEIPDPRWQKVLDDKLRRQAPPRLRWRPATRMVLPAVLFFAATLLVPAVAGADKPGIKAGEHLVRELEDRLATLREKKLVDDAEAEELETALERLAADVAENGLTARQWQAADGLSSRLDDRLGSVVSGAARAVSMLGDLQSAASFAGLDANRPEEFAQSLADALDQAGLGQLLLEQSGIDPEALSTLLSACRGSGTGQGLSPGDCEAMAALAARFAEMAQDRGKLAAALRGSPWSDWLRSSGGSPGAGGITRGRADAALQLAGETKEQAAKFELQELGSRFSSSDAGVKLAEEERRPEVGPDEGARRGAVRGFSETEQQATAERVVLPRHRGAVKRFFSETEER